MQLIVIFLGFGVHFNCIVAVFNYCLNKRVYSAAFCIAQRRCNIARYIAFGYYPRAHRVVNIVIYVGYPVRRADNPALKRVCLLAARMVKDSVKHLSSEVKTLTVLFNFLANPYALLIVGKARICKLL